MFHITNEGDVKKQGFNFWPLKSNHIGVILRVKNTIFVARYSKITKRVHLYKKHKHSE